MIRPFTAVCVLLAGSSGLYLYTEKHRTTVLDQQISRIVQDTQQTRERTAMLRAEWALLNQPDRLAALASRFLPDLHPLAPTQFVQMASLASRLPEIAAPAPVAAPASAEAPDAGRAMIGPTLAPQQVMARAVVSSAPEGDAAMVPGMIPGIVAGRAPKRHPAGHLAQGTAAPAGMSPPIGIVRAHAAVRLVSQHLASTRAAEPRIRQVRIVQASHLASYSASDTPSLLQGALAYTRPTVMPVASHPADVSRSSLGFTHAALPAPVPARDSELALDGR